MKPLTVTHGPTWPGHLALPGEGTQVGTVRFRPVARLADGTGATIGELTARLVVGPNNTLLLAGGVSGASLPFKLLGSDRAPGSPRAPRYEVTETLILDGRSVPQSGFIVEPYESESAAGTWDYRSPPVQGLQYASALPLTLQQAQEYTAAAQQIVQDGNAFLSELDAALAGLPGTITQAAQEAATQAMSGVQAQVDTALENVADIIADTARTQAEMGLTAVPNEAALTGKTAGGYRVLGTNERVYWSGTAITARAPLAAAASQTAQRVASITALRSNAPGNLTAVSGFSSAFGGGGGLFEWRTGARPAEVPGQIVWHASDTSGYWQRLNPTGHVREFGAVGDGVTDDTAAIQAALDWGGRILADGGRWRVSKRVNSYGGSWAFVLTRDGVILDGGGTGTFIASGPTIDYSFIKNPGFDGVRVLNCNFQAEADSTQPSNVRHIVSATGVNDFEFSGNTVTNWIGWGCVVDGASAAEQFQNVAIRNNKFLFAVRATCIWVAQNTTNVHVQGNTCIGETGVGTVDDRILVACHSYARDGSNNLIPLLSYNVNVNGNIVANSSTKGIVVGGCNNATINGNNVSNCRSGITVITETQPSFLIPPAVMVNVTGNTVRNGFAGSTGNRFGIWANRGSLVTITGNTVLVDESSATNAGGAGFTSGIQLDGCNGVDARSNTIQGTDSIDRYVEVGVQVTGTSTGINVIGNTFRRVLVRGVLLPLGATLTRAAITGNTFANSGVIGYDYAATGNLFRGVALENTNAAAYDLVEMGENRFTDDRNVRPTYGSFNEYFLRTSAILRGRNTLRSLNFNAGSGIITDLILRDADGQAYYYDDSNLPTSGLVTRGQVLFNYAGANPTNIGIRVNAGGAWYRQDWSGGGTYLTNEWVRGSNGSVYRAVQDGGQAQDPTTDTAGTYWMLMSATAITGAQYVKLTPADVYADSGKFKLGSGPEFQFLTNASAAAGIKAKKLHTSTGYGGLPDPGDGGVYVDGVTRYKSRTLAQLPAASAVPTSTAIVTNPAAGKSNIVYSNGTNWLYTDGTTAV